MRRSCCRACCARSQAAALVCSPRAYLQVSHLMLSPDGKAVAAGYTTGVVRVYHLASGAMLVALNGHKAAVTAGRYSASGALMVSGGADTDLILWDMVAERGE